MRRLLGLMTLIIVMASMSSCRKPYQEKIYQTIEPNETAFVLPLEGQNKDKQGKFDSEDYLEKNKVAAKRIEIPTRWHQNGRYEHEGKWIPTVRVVVVDRAPVTKKWTGSKNDLNVESKESIAFGIGVTVTASIPEEWASRFLYHYNGRPLKDVVEKDIRPYVQSVLTAEFGSRMLEKCQESRKEINEAMVAKTVQYFKEFGVEIKQLGIVGGFDYESSKIQAAIDAKFQSAQTVISSQNEVEAANNFLKAAKAIKAQKELEADLGIKEAIAEGIRTGKLPVPKTLVLDGNMTLMDIYATTKLE